ncbi:hypothetical protein ACFW9N_11700 [Streptomyces sp. NPDC059496]|uniref:hypothetical protein n=1 Tax=Streptomyces sp. NPDC059496 TaxID=3346851 RepID=UPI003699283A
MTTGPRSAEPTPTPDGSSAPKVAAEGVPPALRPDPRSDDRRRPVAWLHIVAPPSYSASPSVRSWCSCGRDIFTAGLVRALALIDDHEQHRTLCPHITPQEGRKAA